MLPPSAISMKQAPKKPRKQKVWPVGTCDPRVTAWINARRAQILAKYRTGSIHGWN